ncbi:MAG TPA: S41 family peptidase [Dehalococcoidia bacterium]|nr:S41 family peptidase [Dehalococcoidia bacterium]
MRAILKVCAALLPTLVLTLGTGGERQRAGATGSPSATLSSCTIAPPPPGSAPGPPALSRTGPTDLTTAGQAYRCLLDHYATPLQDPALLQGATEGMVRYLLEGGLDQPAAYLPPLNGDPASDWQSFAGMYTSVALALPQDASTQSAFAVATIKGMVQSLHDNHTSYVPLPAAGSSSLIAPPPSTPQSFGLFVIQGPADSSVGAEMPAEFVSDVWTGGPAAQTGLRPGDVIKALNGQSLASSAGQSSSSMSLMQAFAVQGGPIDPTSDWLQQSGSTSVSVSVYRPTSGETLTVRLSPQPIGRPTVAARVLAANVGYVKLYAFTDDSGQQVLTALNGLGLGANLRGVVLDLRGNEGGSGPGVEQLLGLFTHGAVISYFIDGRGNVSPQRTDDSMPLLHQPLVMLIDRASVSAAEATAAAVRDLGLGRLVGQRTAGVVAGAGIPYSLDDGSLLFVDTSFGRGADGEILDGIGVPPDDETPAPTSADLSSGGDPAIIQALVVLAAGIANH